MGWEWVALETEGTDPEFAADVDGAGGFWVVGVVGGGVGGAFTHCERARRE
jgi:hypothetical protein